VLPKYWSVRLAAWSLRLGPWIMTHAPAGAVFKEVHYNLEPSLKGLLETKIKM